MTTIKIAVENTDDARWLIDLLDRLNINASIDDTELASASEVPKGRFSSKEDFMSLCGLWKGRDISAKKLRQKAWRTIDL